MEPVPVMLVPTSIVGSMQAYNDPGICHEGQLVILKGHRRTAKPAPLLLGLVSGVMHKKQPEPD